MRPRPERAREEPKVLLHLGRVTRRRRRPRARLARRPPSARSELLSRRRRGVRGAARVRAGAEEFGERGRGDAGEQDSGRRAGRERDDVSVRERRR